MKIIKPVNGKYPQIPENCYVAENATIVGDVTMGNECSIWFNAVIRGDVHYIKMGNKVNVQDGAIIHGTYLTAPTHIGNNVSIGHRAIVHGCTIHDNVLIGMGAIVMDHRRLAVHQTVRPQDCGPVDFRNTLMTKTNTQQRDSGAKMGDHVF